MTDTGRNSVRDGEGSRILLVGAGRAGCTAAAKIYRAAGGALNTLLCDTDARTGVENPGVPFLLLGGNRLGGAGAGGIVSNARAAAHESLPDFTARAGSPRMAVVVAGLGGGTGGGAAIEILDRLRKTGTATFAFATMPFSFEGPVAAKIAMNARPLVERNADVSVFPSLDALVGCAGTDNMVEAFERGSAAIADAVTLFWRMVETPGFISLDLERLRNLVLDAGPALFLSASASGADRADKILAAIADSPAFGESGKPPKVSKLVLGILGGNDLLLSETGALSDGLRDMLGGPAEFALGTVNDEKTFAGRLSVAALAFAAPSRERKDARRRGGRSGPDPLGAVHSRFGGSEGNIWNGENIDLPTFMRRNLVLER